MIAQGCRFRTKSNALSVRRRLRNTTDQKQSFAWPGIEGHLYSDDYCRVSRKLQYNGENRTVAFRI
ncbi:hypothetical protein RRSWK_04565 [Rhodopirellula sp. SWK7]|nr:hypothetical protein RRSWK_04565 [Rhodopirellula sp. SWK7]